MSTFNTSATNCTNNNNIPVSSLNCLSSPDNIRSIFFTNLVLLGIQEHSSNPAESSLLESSFGLYSSRNNNNSQLPSTQNGHCIFIESKSFGVHGAKPLEFHKNIFAKGHQSSKALEFVLWFLFSRLDWSLTRERFKECWPILDKHHAREFRNVAFKWLDELRKEGCFGVGHNIRPSQQQTTGLGVFLPTIRRSYLDESIGERIDQLVMMLSTYVLSRVIAGDINADSTQQGIKALDLAGAVPGVGDEDRVLAEIDSQIVERSRLFINGIQQQKKTRQSWSTLSNEMTEKLRSINKELTKIESERQTFLAYQPQLAERTNQLTLSELHVLEDRWIEKINAQWEPILSFIERRVGRKEVIQSLLNSKPRIGGAALDDQSTKFNIPGTMRALAENTASNLYGGSKADLGKILSIWKQSLQTLENINPSISPNNQTALRYRGSLETLSDSHKSQLGNIKELKQRLEIRLKESTFESKTNGITSLSSRIGAIRRQAYSSAQQDQYQDLNPHSSTQNTFKSKSVVDILHVKTPVTTSAPILISRSWRHDSSDSHPPAADIKTQAVLRDTVSTKQLSPTHKLQKPAAFSKSIIKPPPSIFGRSTAKLNGQIKATVQNGNVFLSPKRHDVRPVPEDLVAKRSLQEDSSQSTMYNEIITSLTGASSVSMTPPKPKLPFRAYARASTTQRKSNSEPNIPETSTAAASKQSKVRDEFMASILRGANVRKGDIVSKQDPNIVSGPVNTDRGSHESYISVDSEHSNEPQAEIAVSGTDDSINRPSVSSFLKRNFSDELGASRKRRQSSEPLSGQDGATNPVTVESKIVQQKELANVFNVEENEMPRTPSKRRRVGLFDRLVAGQQSPFNFSLETSTNGSPIKTSGIFGTSYLGKSPEYTQGKFTLSNLTLNDLRAPTPKPIKSNSTDLEPTLPIMFLNTPQRKQLSMETTSTIKGFQPLFSLSSPEFKSTRPLSSPKATLKRSAFSSSVFSRFNTGDDSTPIDTQANDVSDPECQRDGRESPESQSFPTSPLQRKSYLSARKPQSRSIPAKPLTPSTITDFITGNSSVGIQQHKSSKQTESTTPKKSHNSAERNGVSNGSSGTADRGFSLKSKATTEIARDILGESTISTSGSDLSAGRNPWGRPPSWKPKSPRMVDMEKKRQLARSSAMESGPLISPMESLKVSVYGRPSVSVPSSLSPTFSSSSISTKSFQSDIGLATSQSYDMARSGNSSRNHDSKLDAMLGKPGEDSDGDTREFISPPVSPISKFGSDYFGSLSTSTSSIRTQQGMNATSGTMSQFNNLRRLSVSNRITRPVQPATFGRTSVSLEPRKDKISKDSTGERNKVKDHVIHTPKEQFLEDPIQEEEFLDNVHGEDETILNQALQTIFHSKGETSNRGSPGKNNGVLGRRKFTDSVGEHNGSRPMFEQTQHENGGGDTSGGLFDEMMPEALDLEEALWENTESFP
ncbi:HAUS augmin-like complex subunit 6 [Entomortierella beljakovae]|nr:HAUS augmin-like complex subunit 6 [Entomortierella beljakovae]